MNRHVLASVCTTVLVLTAVSCDSVNDASTTAEEYVPSPVLSMGVDDPGKMHNDMVRAYAARRPLGSRSTTRKDFVNTCVSACNEVLLAEGLPPQIKPADVERVLSMIFELRRAGVFDFGSPGTAQPIAIVDYWESRGLVSPADAANVRARLTSGILANDYQLVRDNNSAVTRLFDEVYLASRDLWTNREHENNLKGAGTGPKLLTREETMFELDAIGTLFGWWLGGPAGGAFGGYLFSIAFIEMPPANDPGWDCSDFCNMG